MYWLLSSDKFSNPIDPLINCKLTSYCFYNHRVEQSFTDVRPILTLQDTREQSLGSRSRNPSWMTRVFLVARAILTRTYTYFFCTMFIRFIFLIQTTWYSLGYFAFEFHDSCEHFHVYNPLEYRLVVLGKQMWANYKLILNLKTNRFGFRFP